MSTPDAAELSVADALARFERRAGDVVRVRGMLVVPGDAYLVELDVPESVPVAPMWESAPRLELLAEGLFDRLLARVSPYVGGAVAYRDRTAVAGTLVRAPSGRPALGDLTALTVWRRGETYEVDVRG